MTAFKTTLATGAAVLMAGAIVATDVKIKIGNKEEIHKVLDSKSESDIQNVVGWILTRERAGPGEGRA